MPKSLESKPWSTPLQKITQASSFTHEGEQYIYTYLRDQGWHLVANEGRNAVSYRFMKEYNESVADADGGQDNYGLKILLAYYEYYNVFAGF